MPAVAQAVHRGCLESHFRERSEDLSEDEWESQGIAGGVDRRDLPRRAHGRKELRLMPEYSPLSSYFYSGRTPRASDEDDVVRQEWTVRRFQPSYVFCLVGEGAEPELVVAAVDRCEAAVDPSAG